MSAHEQFAEDLALYALGCLEGDDKASLESHLAECAACRRELAQLRGDSALLALTTAGPAPPARAKVRLMEKIAEEPGTKSVRNLASWWVGLVAVAAVAMIIVIAMLWNENAQLKDNAARLAALSEQQKLQLEQAKRIAETLTASDAMHVTVLPVNYKTPPPEGKAIYSRQHGGLIFMANNLHPLPAAKSYELWLIPMQGAPIPAGTFKPDAKGAAMVVNPPLPSGVEAKAFAITIEPEQGSATPTMPIVMQGGV